MTIATATQVAAAHSDQVVFSSVSQLVVSVEEVPRVADLETEALVVSEAAVLAEVVLAAHGNLPYKADKKNDMEVIIAKADKLPTIICCVIFAIEL